MDVKLIKLNKYLNMNIKLIAKSNCFHFLYQNYQLILIMRNAILSLINF